MKTPEPSATIGELVLRPEDLTIQRAARLLLLLEVAAPVELKRPLDVERLSYCDFFAANPFALFDNGSPEANDLLLAGFSSFDLSYQSSGHRYVTRRHRLQADLSFLLSRGLVRAVAVARRVAYESSEDGIRLSERLNSLYAQSYRRSAAHVLRRLDRLTDTALAKESRDRLESTGQLIDLYGSSGKEMSE